MEDVTRRTVLRTGVIVGGTAMWVAPSVLTSVAHAATGSMQPGTGIIAGQVTDASTGDPLEGATVVLDGGTTTTTDEEGNYQFANVPAGTHTVTAGDTGYDTQTDNNVTVTAGATTTENFALVASNTGTVKIVLTWGDDPRDLDLHLSGPDGNGGRFHCYYANKNPVPFVSQDVDDTSGDGPETDSISVYTGGHFVPGSYHAWVHNFSHTYYPSGPGTEGQNFDGSGAKLVVNGLGGTVGTYLVSSATGSPNDDLWYVVDFTLDEAGDLTVTAVHQDFQPGNEGTVL